MRWMPAACSPARPARARATKRLPVRLEPSPRDRGFPHGTLRIVRALCLRLTPILKRAAEAGPQVAAVVGVARAAAEREVAAPEVGRAVGPVGVAEREAARAVAQGGAVARVELVERAGVVAPEARVARVAREERAAAMAEW